MDADYTVVANFAIDQRALTSSSTAGGSVTDPGEGSFDYDHDTVVDIVAGADLNYHFVEWTGTAVDNGKVADPNAASTTVTMDADYTVVANFTIDQRALTASSTSGGSVTDPGEGSFDYDHDTVVDIVAGADLNYHFVNWTGTAVDNGKVADPNAESTTVTMDADYSVVANFAIDQRALTSSSTAGGSVTDPGEGSFDYDHDTVVNIVAGADLNYHFVNWTGTAVDNGKVADANAASTTVTMDADYSVVANFAIDQRALTASSTAGGYVLDPGEGSFYYDHGTFASLAAWIPSNSNYHFVNWTGTAVTAGKVIDPNAAITDMLMDADYTVVANFEPDVEFLGSWVSGLTHTKEAGSNRALIFFVHAEHNAVVDISSITYGGQPMTLAIDANAGTTDAQAYVAAYILDEAGIAAATGDTFVPVWRSTTPLEYSYASVFLSNVNQTFPIGATAVNGSTSENPTITTAALATENGDMVIAAATAGFTGDYTLNNGFSKGYENDMSTSVGTAGYKSANGANETPRVTHTGEWLNRQVILGFVVQRIEFIRTLTTSSTVGGSVTAPGEGDFQYHKGSNITIVATTDLNYHFVSWTGTAVSSGVVADPNSATTIVTVDADYTVVANFAINRYTITASADANGTIDPNGAIIKNGGQDQLFVATANSVYMVDTWYLDGNPVQYSSNAYLLSNIQSNHTVYVTFAFPKDDFNDNRRGAIWRMSADNSESTWLVEDANRLNIRSIGGSNSALYSANGWKFDTSKDFEVKVDFHYSDTNNNEGWVEMSLQHSEDNHVSLSAGFDGNEAYFYYEKAVDGNVIYEQVTRTSDDGTLYISYDAGLDELYLSSTGYGSSNTWKVITGLLAGQWSSEALSIAIGGGSDLAILEQGEAYLDNFEFSKISSLLGWSPATDLDGNGFIELYDLEILCENWLGTDEGDINNNGIVDFYDFAEFSLAW